MHDPYPYERAVALALRARAEPHHRSRAGPPRLCRPGRPRGASSTAARQHDPDLFAGIGDAVGDRHAPRRGRQPDRRARRLRRRRRLLDRGAGAHAAALGARHAARLPSRDEGYGLSAATRRGAARARAPRLLITADCGITACAEVARARELGMDVVVTDHHRPGARAARVPDRAPRGVRLPGRPVRDRRRLQARPGAIYRAAERDPAELERELDLVALATVADLVPLVGENRALVRAGAARDRGHVAPGPARADARDRASIPRASRSRRSGSRSRRASTPPGACTAPTRRSS